MIFAKFAEIGRLPLGPRRAVIPRGARERVFVVPVLARFGAGLRERGRDPYPEINPVSERDLLAAAAEADQVDAYADVEPECSLVGAAHFFCSRPSDSILEGNVLHFAVGYKIAKVAAFALTWVDQLALKLGLEKPAV